MNPTLTTTNEAIDPVFFFIFGASLILLLGITAVMIFFVVRYHRSKAPSPVSSIEGNFWLELTWIILPTILVLAMFYYGWSGYLALRNVPEGALEINCTARMWSWNFTYPGGQSSPKLYVPVGKPVKVSLSSADVIHGFYIPAFRVKRDIVPGMKNQVWFVASKPGSYDIFCSSYCGTGHSSMITSVEALPDPEFSAWMKEAGEGGSPGKEDQTDGKKLAQEKGCLSCHSIDGTKGIAPTLKGLFGAEVRVSKNGKSLTLRADENFIRESIREPGATIVEGYQPVMPPYPDITETEMKALVKFIEELK